MSPRDSDPAKVSRMDTLLQTLAHHVRREIIYYFEYIAESESATLEELIAHLSDRVSDQSRRTLGITLVHNHLPVLSDRGWVDYDSRTNEVRYRGHLMAAQLIHDIDTILKSD